jgi:RNA polymerase sigma factor (sigma-70 family)
VQDLLIKRYARLIKAVVARVKGRVDEDVEQKVAIALWNRVKAEQTIEHPASYIYRCAVRETVRAMKQEREDAPFEGAEQVAAGSPTPHEEAAARELGALTARRLGELGDERRRAAQAHLAGFEVTEIMTMYGWSYQKARNLVARGIADLRARLRADGVDLDD